MNKPQPLLLALILFVPMLFACEFRMEVNSKPIERVTCKGTFTEVTGQLVRMECEDGRVVEYSSYKYNMTRKP